MRNKTPISRVLVFIIALIMTLTCLPLGGLIAYADNSSGTGDSEGWTVAFGELSIWQNNTGVRLYLVDASGGPGSLKVVPFTYNGTQYDLLDIWDPSYKTVSGGDLKFMYGVRVGSTSQSLSALTITYNTLINAGLSSPDYVSDSPWTVSGSGFHSWMTSKVVGQRYTNMAFIMLAFMAGGKADTYKKFTKSYYLIAEPLVCMPAYADKKYDESGYRGTVVGTWYDYMRFNNGSNGGWSAAKARSFANGFKLGVDPPNLDPEDPEYDVKYAAYTKYRNFVKNTIKDNLGLDTPPSYNGDYSAEAHNNGSYFGGPPSHHYYDYFDYVGNTGWGIQVYWDGDPPGGGLPIDTYDIINKKPNDPSNSETPSSDNQTDGEKTIIKLYADLYKDPKTGLYTQIVDKVQYAQKNVSDKVTITNEEPINGYKVSVWYTSNTEYKNLPKASSMFATTNIGVTDGTVKLSSLGGKQLRVNNYTAAKGYAASGGQSYYAGLSSPHGMNGKGSKASYTSKDAKPYTTYKRLAVKGKSNYGTYNYKVNDDDKAKYIELGDSEKTLVVLYTRELTNISTGDYNKDIDISKSSNDFSNDKRKDKSGNISIVKLYGIIDPNTYKITADPSKQAVHITNATRNVNINSETGYNFAEWIYLTGGAGTSITAEKMGSPYLNNYKFDGTADQAYRLDGFVDGFKNNTSLEKYFRFNGKLPTIYTITGSNGLTSSITPGRYSIGSRSGIGNRTYNSTIYFGGAGSLADGTVDGSDTNDVLYLLFLKTDQLTYASDDLVIPQSYLTRYDNYKHNPMTVTGSISGNTRDEYLQAHKFKYLLPVMANGLEYKELNPLFIPHIKKPTGLYFFCLFSEKLIRSTFEGVIIN